MKDLFGQETCPVSYRTGAYPVSPGSGSRGHPKRRPRAEWIIQRDTHPAIITADEAEAIIGTLERGSRSASRRTKADYLLTGVLRSPDGSAWHGDGEGYYRVGKGRRVKAATIEAAVLAQIAENLSGGEFVKVFTAAAKAQAQARKKDSELPALRGLLEKVELNVAAATFQLTYRLSAGDRLASPRLGHSIPGAFPWHWMTIHASGHQRQAG